MEGPVKSGFGRVMLAFFCPPLYFFVRGKAWAGIVHGVLYLLAIATIIFGIGFVFWAVGFFHACWDLAHVKQEHLIQRQATVLAEKLAEKRSL